MKHAERICSSLFLVAFLLTSWGHAQANGGSLPKVRFVTGELTGLLYFVNWTANHPGSTTLYSDFKNKHAISGEEKALLWDWKNSFGDDRSYHRRLELEVVAHTSPDLDVLLSSRMSEFSKGEQAVASKCLTHFAPLYHDFIWSKVAVRADARVAEMQREFLRGNIDKSLEEVENLFGSNWDNGRTITVVVVMLPDEVNPSAGHDAHCDIITSQNNGNIVAANKRISGQLAFVECMPEHDVETELCTVFHELCHTFWYNRPLKTASKLKTNFVDAGGAKAYACFEEAAPTALGSGWCAQQIMGTPSKFWYGIPQIKNYAEAILSLLVQYLNGHRHLDAKFAIDATKLFKNAE